MNTTHFYTNPFGLPTEHDNDPIDTILESTENTYTRYTAPTATSYPSTVQQQQSQLLSQSTQSSQSIPQYRWPLAVSSQEDYQYRMDLDMHDLSSSPSLSLSPEHRPAQVPVAVPPNGPIDLIGTNTSTGSIPLGSRAGPARRVQSQMHSAGGVGTARHDHGHGHQGPNQLSHTHTHRTMPTQPETTTIRCWDHGCEGRKFSSVGNYRRHLREKNGVAKVHPCPDCGRVFTRSTARNFHRQSGSCGIGMGLLGLQMQMQMGMNLGMGVGMGQGQTQPLDTLSNTLASQQGPVFNVNVGPPLFDPLQVQVVDWGSGSGSEHGQMDLYAATAAAAGVVFDR
ncbi:hypothetical protein BDW74DRAFT_141357 [Aspergillus multicolor]|uniref:uncharacterized protein n=1 Tax=Aspergillus multicolor TaxID=41759 RepID=UPI003CCCEFB0